MTTTTATRTDVDVMSTTTNDSNDESTARMHDHDSATSSHDFVTINDLIHHLARKMRALENDNARLRLALVRQHNGAPALATAPKNPERLTTHESWSV